MKDYEAFIGRANEESYTQVLHIDTAALKFDEGLIALCAQNACGHYDTSWTCPPGCGEMEALQKKIQGYPNGVVLQMKYDIEDSFDFEGMQRAGDDFNERFFKMQAKCKETIGSDFYALKAGSCHLCDTCTYPDEPCVHPDTARPSIEACGINVSALCKLAGIPYIYGANTVAYVALFLFH